MCEYCNEMKFKRCNILIEEQIGMRNKTSGKLEFVPNFKEIFVPLNYCPICGRKLEGK